MGCILGGGDPLACVGECGIDVINMPPAAQAVITCIQTSCADACGL
jgi:hypothetical protein